MISHASAQHVGREAHVEALGNSCGKVDRTFPATSDAAGNEVMKSIDRYFDSGKSEDSKISLDNYIAGFAKAVADNAGNPQAWEEFMIGALSSTVGMPVFGSQTKNAYMKLGPVGFAGGMAGSYKDYMAEKKHENDIATYLNDRVHGKNSQKFRALYDYLRKSEDYEQALMTALENNDKEEYKNLEAEKLFSKKPICAMLSFMSSSVESTPFFSLYISNSCDEAFASFNSAVSYPE